MIEQLNSVGPFLESFTLAQVAVDDLVDEGVGIISKVTLLIAVAGISYGGYTVTRGEIQNGILAILGSLLIGFAFPIASEIFELAK